MQNEAFRAYWIYYYNVDNDNDSVAFLIIFVAPIDVILFKGKADRLTISIVQASIAIIVTGRLILGLSRLKKIYMQKNLVE